MKRLYVVYSILLSLMMISGVNAYMKEFYLSAGENRSFEADLRQDGIYIFFVSSSSDFGISHDLSSDQYVVLENNSEGIALFIRGDGEEHKFILKPHESGDYKVMFMEDESPYTKFLSAGKHILRENIESGELVTAILISEGWEDNRFLVLDPFGNVISASVGHEKGFQFSVFVTPVSGKYRYVLDIEEPGLVIFATPKAELP